MLDGWWAEACEHGVNGWAIGGEDPGDDDTILGALFRTLEDEVVPTWKEPDRWAAMMRASVAMADPRFTADRMVREYFTRLYEPDASPSPTDASPAVSVLRSASM